MGKNANKRKRRKSKIYIKHEDRTPKDRLPIIRRMELLFAGALTGLIVFLYMYRASRVGALWRDEVATIGVATMPSFSQLWSSLPHECCSILPYIGLRTWIGVPWLGGGDASLRILATSIGVGILLVFWLNRKGLGYTVPIFSLVLFGLNPTVIRFLVSIRGYGLGTLFILLACGLIWKVVTSPSKGRVALAALVSVLSVHCLYQNAFFLFAICLGASFVCIRKRRWKRILLVLGIGAISALSLIPYLATIRKAQEVLVVVQASYSWSFIFERLRESFSFSLEFEFLWWIWVVCSAVCILTSSYFIVYKRNDPEHEDTADLCIFNLTVMVMSAVLLVVFLKSTGLPTSPWYYITLMGVIAISVDIGLEQAANTFRRRIGRLVVALAVAGLTLPITWQIVPERFTNLDIIASVMEERASEEDLIILYPYYLGITFQHYYQGKTKWMTIPPIEDLKINRFDLIMEKMSAENPLQPVWDEIEKSLRSGNRVWMTGKIYLPPEGELPHVPPAAPNGREGWSYAPYLQSWGVQLGYFLNSHVVEGQVVPMEIMDEVRTVPYLEAPIVQVGKGWR